LFAAVFFFKTNLYQNARGSFSMDYSVNSLVGELLDNPQTKAVLDRHIPEFSPDPRVRGARTIPLKMISGFSQDTLTPERLAAIDADLALCRKSFSIDSRVGELLDNPRARAVLDKYAPDFAANPNVHKARDISLKMVSAFSRDNITSELLEKLDAELSSL
jgi:hypothetical protein